MEVYTCDSVSYVICRNLAFLMLDLETSVGVGMVHFREKNYRNEQPEKANHTGWAIVPMRVGVTLSYIL